MPDIGSIEQQEFTIPVNVLGSWLLVTYRPFGITMDMSMQQLVSQQAADMTGLYDAFCATVTAWDLYESDKSDMVAITPQRLCALPSTLVMIVLEACMDDKGERQAQIVAERAGTYSVPHALVDRLVAYTSAMGMVDVDGPAPALAGELTSIMEA